MAPPAAKNAKGPAKKAAAAKKAAEAAANEPLPKFISLPDGRQIPVSLPPGVDPAQARAAIALLQSNPEAAKETLSQAQRIMQNPAMARQMMGAMQPQAAPAPGGEDPRKKMFEVLKDEPEFKEMFEDIQKNGPGALEKYWNDTDLMTKISQKLKATNISDAPAAAPKKAAAAPKKAAAPTTLRDAVKAGDVALTKKFLEGADINEQDERGITVLGIAAGFNRIPIVGLLIKENADVNIQDKAGNTVLHYAAGYGRVEIAGMLLDAGADAATANNDGQTPLNVAELNRENACVELLTKQAEKTGAADATFVV